MNRIKINWFGSGVEIRRLRLPEESRREWEAMALKQNRTLIELLLDPFFYYKLKDKNVNSLEEVPCEQFSGILNENKNQVEFWFKNKKIFKTNTAEIVNEMLLFPMFNLQPAQDSFTDQKGIYIVNKEIGTLGVFVLHVQEEKLLLDDFIVETELFQSSKIISSISFKNQYFRLVKKDTIIIHQSGFEIR